VGLHPAAATHARDIESRAVPSGERSS